MDMNDWGFRNIVVVFGGKVGGILREIGFNIMVVSEIMVIFCLSNDFNDLKEKCGVIYVGDIWEGKFIYVCDFKVEGVMVVLFKDVIKFNLV